MLAISSGASCCWGACGSSKARGGSGDSSTGSGSGSGADGATGGGVCGAPAPMPCPPAMLEYTSDFTARAQLPTPRRLIR
ncbi:hypothetical protein GPK78_07360 [Desulfovibrio desulfuricans]|nr:hypothetical protein [Desulfovibrio desulfuricans]